MTNKYIDIASQYVDKPIGDIKELNGGHINQSLLISAGRSKYVLQCLNPVILTEQLRNLESNYRTYKAACEAAFRVGDSSPCKWECPEWITDQSGQYFHKDAEGKTWRLYRYIHGDVLTRGEPYEAGLGLGRIHRILKNCDISDIHPVFPNLHNLKHYYGEFLAIKDAGSERDRELDDAMTRSIDEMLSLPALTNSVIHGDAKVSNMIARNGRVVGLIDLDTIMVGSVYDDIADCMRSCCMDEYYNPDNDKIAAMLRGYTEGSGTLITPDMDDIIRQNLAKNKFMLGIRYYTDYLTGNKYFKEANPGDNLKKARRLILGK